MLITSERWEQFLTLVRDLRHLQRLYRKSLDSATRRIMEDTEDVLDATVAHLIADLRVPVPVPVPVPDALVLAEGGAP